MRAAGAHGVRARLEPALPAPCHSEATRRVAFFLAARRRMPPGQPLPDVRNGGACTILIKGGPPLDGRPEWLGGLHGRSSGGARWAGPSEG